MKKILLATTMLAGTAGFASAEVSVTGWAEMGIWSNTEVNGNAGPGEDGVAFFQDVEIRFIGSGTTDGGLEFGAQIDLDETHDGDEGLSDGNRHFGTHVFISGPFGKLTLGDTDGAVDWALADLDSGMSAIADDHSTHVAWFGGNDFDSDGPFGAGTDNGDGQILRYENTFGEFGVAVSLEQGDDGLDLGAANVDDTFGIGVKYTAALAGTDVKLGLAYQDGGDNGSEVGVSAAATFAEAFTATIAYISFDDVVWDLGPTIGTQTVDSHFGAELTYKSGPIGVGINYGKYDYEGGDIDSVGVVGNYDLGGGAIIELGYGSNVNFTDPTDEVEQWSLGILMNF